MRRAREALGPLLASLMTGAFAPSALAQVQQHPQQQPHQETLASIERSAPTVQTVHVSNVAHLLAARFDPMFNVPTFPGPSKSARYTGLGLAAGESASTSGRGISLWANAANSWIEDKFIPTQYDGTSRTGAIGADFQLGQRLTAGVSATYARTDIDTPFNSGSSKTDGYTLLPYVHYSFNDWLAGDVSVGYTWSETDMSRITAGTFITGRQKSDGAIALANLSATKWHGLMLLGGKVGLLHSSDSRASFVESDGTVHVSRTNQLTQLRIGGSIGYWHDGVLPSLSLTYARDLKRADVVLPGGGPQPANDRDGLTVGLGVSVYGVGGNKGLTIGLAASTELLRKDLRNKSLSLNVRLAI